MTPRELLFWSKAVTLVTVTAIAHAPALQGQFIWDDYSIYVRDNPLIHAPDGLLRFWFSTEAHDYYPVTYSAFWVEWRLWGAGVAGYHIVNLLTHLGCCALAWRLLWKWEVHGAWLAALVFAVHPVNVEAVAWISQLKTLLAAFFGLASALCLESLPSNVHGAAPERRAKRAARAMVTTATLLFAASLLSKLSMIGMPLAWALMDRWRSGRWRRCVLWSLTPLLFVTVVLGVVEVWFQTTKVIASDPVRPESALSRFAAVGWIAWFYLGKAVLPIDLMFVYPRWTIDPADPLVYLPSLALIAVLCLGWAKRRGLRAVAFLWSLHVLLLLPVLGLVDVYYFRFSLVADHYQYPALLVAIVAVIEGMIAAAHSRFSRRSFRLERVGYPLAVGVVLVFTWLSRQESASYRDEEGLWNTALRKNPDAWLAHANLGVLLAKSGDPIAAAGHFQAAMRLDPENPKHPHHLGKSLAQMGQLDAAIDLYTIALRLQQGSAAIHNDLGLALLSLRRPVDARNEFARAIELEPRTADWWVNLASARYALGEKRLALDAINEALRLDPEHQAALANKKTLLNEPEEPGK